MTAKKENLHIAVIDKMLTQIREVKGKVQRDLHDNTLSTSPAVSTTSLRKALRDIEAQEAALQCARDTMVRAFGAPETTVELQRIPGSDRFSDDVSG